MLTYNLNLSHDLMHGYSDLAIKMKAEMNGKAQVVMMQCCDSLFSQGVIT